MEARDSTDLSVQPVYRACSSVTEGTLRTVGRLKLGCAALTVHRVEAAGLFFGYWADEACGQTFWRATVASWRVCFVGAKAFCSQVRGSGGFSGWRLEALP